MSHVPDWWQVLLLVGASFRTFRLIAADIILDRLRDRLTGRDSYEEAPTLYRRKLDEWMHCPWCMGFWITLTWWGAWLIWPNATLIAATPLTINAGMALIAKHLDA